MSGARWSPPPCTSLNRPRALRPVHHVHRRGHRPGHRAL
jgi:hypothetical protein